MATATATRADSTTTTTEPVDLFSSSPHSLHRAVLARRADYVRPHRIRAKIGTWNVAACPGTDKDLASWFVAGLGVDKRLASLDLARNPAVERDTEGGEQGWDGREYNRVRLVGGDKIGLYVLGLQEVVELGTLSYVSRVYAEPVSVVDKWKAALEAALPVGYRLVTCEQLTGLLLLIYASPEVAPTVGNVSTVSVGTGLMGVMGNKGAVTSRLVLGESTRMVFINSHLASGTEPHLLERRIWDVNQILARTIFKPVALSGVEEESGEKIGDEDFAFWFGDLNFRLDGIPGDDIRRLLMLHTRGEYDVTKMRKENSMDSEIVLVDNTAEGQNNNEANHQQPVNTPVQLNSTDDESSETLPDPNDFRPDPHDDPTSLQATLDSLLSHDQLRRLVKERKVFHDGWREGPITFLPSYKYDVGTIGLFDSSEKRRPPSWCDRILYRTRRDKEGFEMKTREEETARKRDEEMKAQGLDDANRDEEVLFDYDPENDGDDGHQDTAGLDYDDYDGRNDDNGVEQVVTKEGFLDRIEQEIYASHQRITSSDHKPIIAIFTLDYDAVVPELKAKVTVEVARELDRVENEGRPSITIVVDRNEAPSTRLPNGDQEDGFSDLCADFGDVQFLRKRILLLTLANTGRVSATFSFIDKPSTEELGQNAASHWLATSFVPSDALAEDADESFDLGKEVTLEPGETVKAILELCIDDVSHARRLNDGQATLDDVLVLRVVEGRDHFIPIKARWSPTCIGRSLDELIRVPDGGGIRALVRSLANEKSWTSENGAIPKDLPVVRAAPKELFKLTELAQNLTEHALADEQMLAESAAIPSSPGWPFDKSTWKVQDKKTRRAYLAAVIAALDTDAPSIAEAFAPETTAIERLEVIADVLLLFLGALRDGIVCEPQWSNIEAAALPSLGISALLPSSTPASPITTDVAEDDKTTVLDFLAAAPARNISFVFLTTTLTRMIAELAPLSKADIETLRSPPLPPSPSKTGGLGAAISRRSLSLRRTNTTTSSSFSATPALVKALERRRAREKRYAEIFGPLVCRAAGLGEREKERRAVEDRQRGLVELFLKAREAA